jgi:hypothetical protein
MYPRLFFYHGRIRVEIETADGQLCHPEIKNSKSPNILVRLFSEIIFLEMDLLKYMGQNIPRLNSRVTRMKSMEEAKAAAEQDAAVASAGQTNSKKKKGNNKKK